MAPKAMIAFGLVLATIYLVLAIVAVILDRKETGGGWITLRGMASYLITLPVSAVGELISMKPDFRRNVDMAFVIGLCTVLVYFCGASIGKLARLAFPAVERG